VNLAQERRFLYALLAATLLALAVAVIVPLIEWFRIVTHHA
jgi:hypothetical protein